MTSNNDENEVYITVAANFSNPEMFPFVTVTINNDEVIPWLDPINSFRLGMELMLKARSLIDESALIEVLAAREIPLDTTLSIIQAIRRKRARTSPGD